MRNTRLYNIWRSMRQRCGNEKNINYKNYGGIGIQVCHEWNKFQTFAEWALNAGYKENLTIDRIDVKGNYCPENCRWVSYKIQGNNKNNNRLIEFNGEIHTLSEWSEIVGIKPSTLWKRLKNGWELSEALNSTLKVNQYN